MNRILNLGILLFILFPGMCFGFKNVQFIPSTSEDTLLEQLLMYKVKNSLAESSLFNLIDDDFSEETYGITLNFQTIENNGVIFYSSVFTCGKLGIGQNQLFQVFILQYTGVVGENKFENTAARIASNVDKILHSEYAQDLLKTLSSAE